MNGFQNAIFFIQQNEVRVTSHYFQNELFFNGIAQFIARLKTKTNGAIHGNLFQSD